MHSKEYSQLLCLVACLQLLKPAEFPHRVVTLALYDIRFKIPKIKFKYLVSRFLEVGYNPLLSTDDISETIMIKNIIALL